MKVKYTKLYRIWYMLLAFSLLGLFLSVLFFTTKIVHYTFASFLLLAMSIRLFMILTKEDVFPLVLFFKDIKVKRFKHAIHFLIVVFLIIMAFSGMLLYFQTYLSFNGAILAKVHTISMYGLSVCIMIHLVGVLLHDLKSEESLVSQVFFGKDV